MRALSSLNRRDQWVDAAPFRAHVRHAVSVADVPWQVLAVVSGVPLPAVRSLLFGRSGRPLPRIEPRLATRLLRVSGTHLQALSTLRVGAHDTSELLRDALVAGVEPLRLARWCRLTPTELALLVDGEATACSRLTEALARAAHRRVCDGAEPMHRFAA